MRSKTFTAIAAWTLIFICQTVPLAQKPELIVQSIFTEAIDSAVFSPDGRFLVTGAIIQFWGNPRYRQFLLWDARSGKVLRQLEADFIDPELDEDSDRAYVVFSKSGRYVAVFVGGWQCEPSFIFEVATGRQISQIDSCIVPSAIGFDAADTLFYAVEHKNANDKEERIGKPLSRDLDLAAWNLKTGKKVAPVLTNLAQVDFNNRVVNAGSGYIGSSGMNFEGCRTGKLSFLELKTRKPYFYEAPPGRKICDSVVSENGNHLAVSLDDSTIRIINLKDGKEKGVIRNWGVEGFILRFFCEFNKTGEAFVCLNQDEESVKIWTERPGDLPQRFPFSGLSVTEEDPAGLYRQFIVFKWNPDGRSFLTQFKGKIKISDVQNSANDFEFESALPKNLFPETIGSESLPLEAILSRYDKSAINRFIAEKRPENAEFTLSDGSGVFDCGTEIKNLKTHKTFQSPVCDGAYSTDGKKYLGKTGDAKVKIFDAQGGELATFYPIGEKDWAVVDKDGRFDCSEGAKSFLHYVVWSKTDYEIISFEQLKSKFYEPDLWKKILAGEPLTLTGESLKSLNNIALYPKIKLSEPAGNTRGRPCLSEKGLTLELDPSCRRFSFNLQARNGGIGKYVLRINDREVQEFQPPSVPPAFLKQEVNLDNYQRYLIPDNPQTTAVEKNRIEIVAYNAEGWLPSRGSEVVYLHRETVPETPNLWVLAVGVSDYRGEANGLRDLAFADKDAEAMANVLKLSGERLFPRQATVKLLTSTAQTPAELSNKTNIRRVLSEFHEKAKSTDVVIFYLAGHGVAYGSAPNDDFYFLTNEAGRADLQDAAVRETTAVSGEEIVKLLTKIPAFKQVLILDTCASGKVVEQLTKSRDDASKNYRAWDRMKDRAGLWLLAGSTSDAVSYESSTFGQGVLTYSLLRGIKEDADRALRKDEEGNPELMDVSTLFEYSRNEVPKLAKGIGGIQKPVIFNRAGEIKEQTGSFDIGRVTPADRAQIKLSHGKPAFVRTRFVIKDNQFGEDELELTKEMNRALQLEVSRGVAARIAFLQTDEKFPGAFLLKANYEKNGDQVTVTAKISQYVINAQGEPDGSEQIVEKEIEVLKIVGQAGNIQALTEEIIKQLVAGIGQK